MLSKGASVPLAKALVTDIASAALAPQRELKVADLPVQRRR